MLEWANLQIRSWGKTRPTSDDHLLAFRYSHYLYSLARMPATNKTRPSVCSMTNAVKITIAIIKGKRKLWWCSWISIWLGRERSRNRFVRFMWMELWCEKTRTGNGCRRTTIAVGIKNSMIDHKFNRWHNLVSFVPTSRTLITGTFD